MDTFRRRHKSEFRLTGKGGTATAQTLPLLKARIFPVGSLLWLACLAVAAGVAHAQMIEVTLNSFKRADGADPHAGVILDPAGNLYGTTYNGAASDHGTVYKMDTSRHETVLYSFTGGAGSGNPNTGVIRDSAGDLYGTTLGGAASDHGTVYKVDTSGHETVLYSFTGGDDGGEPEGGVIPGSRGSLYSTTEGGGKHNVGTILAEAVTPSRRHNEHESAKAHQPTCDSVSPATYAPRTRGSLFRVSVLESNFCEDA
jgi:uncharacterized repeat protein (TIGR03803 family)